MPFPTHGVLPCAPHTRLLICKPESSQADHSDQAIQPPKRREKEQSMEFPDKQQHHIKLRRPGSQRAHPSCRHPQPLTYPRQPNSPNRPKSVCDVNRTGRVNPWRVCLVHSRDVCLLSQALVLFPRSRPPGINKKALYPRAKANPPPTVSPSL